jgi:hypothetical protein
MSVAEVFRGIIGALNEAGIPCLRDHLPAPTTVPRALPKIGRSAGRSQAQLLVQRD